MEGSFDQEKDISIEEWLSGAIRRLLKSLEDEKGIALLIDLDKRPSLAIFTKLINDLIPRIDINLHELDKFRNNKNQFRVVLAIRNYAEVRDNIRRETGTELDEKILFKVLQLRPFNFEVIRDSIRKHLSSKGYTNDVGINQFSADLLFFTGGHPGCIAEILDIYQHRGTELSSFFDLYHQKIWDIIVHPKIEHIRANIFSASNILESVIDNVSVFRYLDYFILSKLIEENGLAKELDQYTLADKLTKSFLLSWKKRFLSDDITRRLLVIRQWQTSPKLFLESCVKAQKFCLTELSSKDPNSHDRERWAIEYLFQGVQQYAGFIQTPKSREELRKRFMTEFLPEALQHLAAGRNLKAEYNALRQSLDEDWEFQFAINYYLRNDNYDGSPYKLVKKHISEFFTQK